MHQKKVSVLEFNGFWKILLAACWLPLATKPTSHIQLVIHFTSFFCCLELKNHLKSSVDFDATTCCFVFLLETKEKSLIFRIELLLFTLFSSVVAAAVVSCLKLSSRFIFHTQCTYTKALEEISGPKVLMKSIFWFHGFLQWANRCSIPQWGHKFQGKNLYFTFHHEKICINMFNSTHRTNDISKWF